MVSGKWKLYDYNSASAPSSHNTLLSPRMSTNKCHGVMSQIAFKSKSRSTRKCVICKFENQYASQRTVVCSQHNVPLCQTLPKEPYTREKPYFAPNRKDSCWDKFHTFYQPQGLFTEQGNLKKTHALLLARNNDYSFIPLRQ